MGYTSAHLIFRHYREVVRPGEAAKYWAIFPKAGEGQGEGEWLNELKAGAHFLFQPTNALHAKAGADAQRNQIDPNINPFKDWDKKGQPGGGESLRKS
jgi:hypothetical protein